MNLTGDFSENFRFQTSYRPEEKLVFFMTMRRGLVHRICWGEGVELGGWGSARLSPLGTFSGYEAFTVSRTNRTESTLCTLLLQAYYGFK